METKELLVNSSYIALFLRLVSEFSVYTKHGNKQNTLSLRPI